MKTSGGAKKPPATPAASRWKKESVLSQQLRSNGLLLDSIDALRNWRAALVLLATLVVMALVFGLSGLLSQWNLVLFAMSALLAFVVLFYGVSAAGIMLMDEALGRPSRSAAAAVLASLSTSHHLLVVWLLVGGAYLAGLLAMALALFLCRIPALGPVLYVLVFPLCVAIAGIAACALPALVIPLSAPAIWAGGTTAQCIRQLLAFGRRKQLLQVLLLMLGVGLLASVVAVLAGAVLISGAAITGLLSVPILGGGGVDLLAHNNALAAAIGGGVLSAIAFTLPGLVYLRGACIVYLRTEAAGDLVPQAAAPAAPVAPVMPPVAPQDAGPAPIPPSLPAACPRCHNTVLPAGLFCGECGFKLR